MYVKEWKALMKMALITCFLIEIIKREVCKYKMLKYTDCIEIHPKMCYDE